MTRERSIQLLELRRQYGEIRSEVDAAIRRVVDSQSFVLGPEVEAFEEEFAAYCGSRFAIGCASGSDALLLALMALEIGSGDQVVCPGFSFVASASSIVRAGARPLFVDIDPASYLVDPECIREMARSQRRIGALLPVDLFGQTSDLQACLSIAEDLGVPVIEDAAQAVGAIDQAGRKAGSRAKLGCFSLYPTKNLGAFGDAGVVVTDDPELAERIRALGSHGSRTRYVHEQIGINSRLDAVQAAVLRVKLRHLASWTLQRQELAARYDRSFAEAGAVGSDKSFEDGVLPLKTPRPPGSGARHVYHQYCVRVPAPLREPLRCHLADRGIASAVYYPLGLHQQPCFAELGYREGDLPETEAAARECLALPIHAELADTELDRVVDCVVEFLSR